MVTATQLVDRRLVTGQEMVEIKVVPLTKVIPTKEAVQNFSKDLTTQEEVLKEHQFQPVSLWILK